MNIKEVCGVYLPESDTHFEHHLKDAPLVNGKPTYQLKKIEKGVGWVPEKHRRVALDVGAHVGLWSMVLSQYFDEVIAFEPHPVLAECFRKNCDGLQNVTLFNYGLYAFRMDHEMVFDKSNTGNTRLHPKPTGFENAYLFEFRSLDSLELGVDSIDFLKVDVEGNEYYALLGGEMTIRTHGPVCVIEQKPGNAEQYGLRQYDALNLMKRWGFKEVWEIAGDHCVVPESIYMDRVRPA